MNLIPSLTFIFLIFFAAFCMEAIGSYVSIVGLGALFAGDYVILLMALILDVAKIVTVSFIYQYWSDLKKTMKYYMLSAVIVLMTITSCGAFGYLSGAFQLAMQPNMEVILKVESLKREKEQLASEKVQLLDRKSKIDQQIAQLPAESVKGRRQLITSFKPETEQIMSRTSEITKRVDQLTTEILKAESENIEKSVHAGPITYVSKAFNISIEEASKWIILTIISVFDPLAVMLIVSGNFLVVRRRELKAKLPEHILETKIVSTPVVEEEVLIQEPIHVPIHVPIQEPIQAEKELTSPITEEKVLIQEPIHNPIHEPIQETDYKHITSLAYDCIDTGEEEIFEEIDTSQLESTIKEYVPSSPEEPTEILKSSLEDLTISIPQALIREGVTTRSKKRELYENVG
jgi:hypothetical protein